jgi:general secretion pathway protein M
VNWLRAHRRTALLVGLTLLLPAYLYLSSLIKLIGLGLDYRGERSRLEPRLARVQGLLMEREELQSQSARAAQVLREQVYADAQDPSALAASLQAEARQIFIEAGLAISNSQVLPLRRGELFDEVAVKIAVEGSIAALDGALVGIAAHRPRMLVEAIDVFPVQGPGRGAEQARQMLSAVVQLKALRAVQ